MCNIIGLNELVWGMILHHNRIIRQSRRSFERERIDVSYHIKTMFNNNDEVQLISYPYYYFIYVV